MIDFKKARGLALELVKRGLRIIELGALPYDSDIADFHLANTINDLCNELEKVTEENKWLTRAHMLDLSYLTDNEEIISLERQLVACHTLRDQHKTDLAEALVEIDRLREPCELAKVFLDKIQSNLMTPQEIRANFHFGPVDQKDDNDKG